MILVKPSHEILFIQPNLLQLIEIAGRTCYKSESMLTNDSAEKFVEMVVKREHLSVIEHANVTVRFICDRGVTHELVRHRLAAYSQESTRYCNYKSGVAFVIPPWCENLEEREYVDMDVIPFLEKAVSEGTETWILSMLDAENSYIKLLNEGWSPQQARAVLPNSLKTEIVMTCNLREWRHVLNLRCSAAAHPQMRELMTFLLKHFYDVIPVIFDDLWRKYVGNVEDSKNE